jgi:hypothetical protein
MVCPRKWRWEACLVDVRLSIDESGWCPRARRSQRSTTEIERCVCIRQSASFRTLNDSLSALRAARSPCSAVASRWPHARVAMTAVAPVEARAWSSRAPSQCKGRAVRAQPAQVAAQQEQALRQRALAARQTPEATEEQAAEELRAQPQGPAELQAHNLAQAERRARAGTRTPAARLAELLVAEPARARSQTSSRSFRRSKATVPRSRPARARRP